MMDPGMAGENYVVHGPEWARGCEVYIEAMIALEKERFLKFLDDLGWEPFNGYPTNSTPCKPPDPQR